MHCGGYSQKILWEDDEPRAGMRRRGPANKRSPKIAQERVNMVRWIIEPQVSEVEDIITCEEIISSGVAFSGRAKVTSTKEDEIKKRGGTHCSVEPGSSAPHRRPRLEVCVDDLFPSSPFRFLSPHPLSLTPLQSLFFDHYLNNFSLKYPTYLDPSNPFLSTLVPLALRNSTVLCAVLAIGGIQTGLEGRPDVKAEILTLKGRALRGCRNLLQSSDSSIYLVSDVYGNHAPPRTEANRAGSDLLSKTGDLLAKQGDEEDDLMLFASAMLLMVHDKLSGEPCSNLRPHLKFAHHFERRTILHSLVSVHYKFLRNIFLYNDLLASIASGSPTLRDYGQNTIDSVPRNPSHSDGPVNGVESSMFKLARNRYYLPILLSRIANGTNGVTSADIEQWDGNMTWLPSFSSTHIAEVLSTIEQQPPSTPIANESENKTISEIYRNAARVFYFRRERKRFTKVDEEATSTPLSDLGGYDFQIQHFNSILLANLRSLPLGSAYESSLLFPIGIAAMEIHDLRERAYVLSRLQLLEDRFQLDHFRKFREKLSAFWEGSDTRFAGQQFDCDAILLG